MPTLVPPAIPAGTLAASRQPTLPVTAGAALRPWRGTDAAAVAEAYRDPQIQRWHVRRADSVDEARGWIEGWQRDWPAERGCHWAVAGDGTGVLLGRVSLRSLDLEEGFAELAYWMTPAARGAGVCTQAVRAVVRWALGPGGFHRLEIQHSRANHASCRVADRAGFTLEGVRRAAVSHADGWHDMHVHARIRQDEAASWPYGSLVR